MPDPDLYHCRACSTRPLANLTLQDDGKLWRPECMYTVALFAWQSQTLAPHRSDAAVLATSRAAEYGLVVVEGGKRPRRRRT